MSHSMALRFCLHRFGHIFTLIYFNGPRKVLMDGTSPWTGVVGGTHATHASDSSHGNGVNVAFEAWRLLVGTFGAGSTRREPR